MFSNEVHFHLNEYVNKQNCRYWSSQNFKVKHQKPFPSPNLKVWATILFRGIIGSYLFEVLRGVTVFVNSTGVCKNVTSTSAVTVTESWLHSEHLDATRGKPLTTPLTSISRRRYIPWSPNNPDLSPVDDFFLWENLANLVYSSKPATSLFQIKANIRKEMPTILLG